MARQTCSTAVWHLSRRPTLCCDREPLHSYLQARCNMCCPGSEGICIATLSLLTPFQSPQVLDAVSWELLGLCPNRRPALQKTLHCSASPKTCACRYCLAVTSTCPSGFDVLQGQPDRHSAAIIEFLIYICSITISVTGHVQGLTIWGSLPHFACHLWLPLHFLGSRSPRWALLPHSSHLSSTLQMSEEHISSCMLSH